MKVVDCLTHYIRRNANPPPLPMPFLVPTLTPPQATPNECLVLAVKAMELHPDLWQCYFDDFLVYKLRLGGLNRGAISHQVLRVLFQQLHKQDAISRVVSLHCYTHFHHVDLVKMANLLQPLNQIQQVGECSEVLSMCFVCMHLCTKYHVTGNFVGELNLAIWHLDKCTAKLNSPSSFPNQSSQYPGRRHQLLVNIVNPYAIAEQA